MSNIISISNLRKYYGTARGIEDVSFEVRRGEIVGFVGPNGSGKSTTIKILMGLVSCDSGSATIDGQGVFDNADIRRRIGYISSDSIFYKRMTPREIFEITAGVFGKGRDVYPALCERLQLDTRRKISQLSMGNRKKVGIINALMTNPDIMIFDEPTNGLDPLIQKEFFAMVGEARSRGATVLISTHIMSDVQRYCDRAVIIREGRIVADSSVKELLSEQVKSIHIMFDSSPPDISGLPGAEGLHVEGNIITGSYSGELSELLQLVSRHKINDFSISDGGFDSVLSKYYEPSGGAQ